jgi:hypothetical protein
MKLMGRSKVSILGTVVALVVIALGSLPTRVDAGALCNVGNSCTLNGVGGSCGPSGQGGVCMCIVGGQQGQSDGCQRIQNPPLR